MKRAEVVAFLGPSLSRLEAARIINADFRPPAEQGDVWRAMRSQPRVIALIDGVFEARPSVWHHELRSALDSGITVFGASSMGALRAAELSEYGMVGVGQIFEHYRSGVWNDDADVALLHGPADFDFKGLTIPLVNIVHNAARAQRLKLLTAREAREWKLAARSVFYQDRTWPSVVDALSGSWKPARIERLTHFWKTGREDLKALDARACLSAVAQFVKAPRGHPSVKPTVLSSYARARWAQGAYASPARETAGDGLRALLLAELAASRGLKADGKAVRVWVEHLSSRGVDASSARRWAERLALAELAEHHALSLTGGRVVPAEAAALEAVLRQTRR